VTETPLRERVGLLVGWLLVAASIVGSSYAVWHNHRDKQEETTAGSTATAKRPISVAPAFTAQQLGAEASEHWVTNGGSLANRRFSQLDQIDTGNVGKLKGVWLTHLAKAATGAKYSAESQPVVYRGTLYVSTGANDVFAVDVATGKIRWRYKAHLNQEITSVCCGWGNRGVALGGGRVYMGQLDGKLVALDQRTGKRVWSSKIEDWRNGYTITSAPLYYEGRVYTGISGGEFQARGRLTAVDAKTGKVDWRFYTVPGPGEVGHNTWPKNSDAWKRGGAPVWQTPAVDPELGMLYLSTGNASPDDDGHVRAGDNLFTSSIVAIDAKTGKYRWHFQQVHHDIWDYDGPSPVVLFDAQIKGKRRQALAEANKTGWVYVLDRKTGKAIFPINEKPVPQNRFQNTAKTQPIPSTQPIVDQKVTDKELSTIKGLAAKSPETKGLPVKRGHIYEPLHPKHITVVKPGPTGGNNWPPPSYNPRTHMLYVCQLGAPGGYSVGLTKRPSDPGKAPYLASIWTITGFTQNPGTLAAFDVTTGKIAWQTKWKDSCYSGSTSTAGNVVFVGRNNGELQAYHAQTGKQLWSFQTGAGANNTPTVFENDGKEYVAFYAGGNGLASTQHGDNLWLFGLDGKLGPVKAGGPGKGVQHAGENTEDSNSRKGDPAAGKKIFADNCSACHGLSGHGGNGGPDLTKIPSAKERARVIEQIQKGGGGMPGFETQLTPQQIADVAAYVLQVTGGK
jgi:alcohol dehydrogenase (cytochrome c)